MMYSISLLLSICSWASVHEKNTDWGFYAHGLINRTAVYLLPPQMRLYYQKHQSYLEAHATDPDKRRYAVADEGPRHYIDLDRYNKDNLPPLFWSDAVKNFGEDSLRAHGIVPWHIETMRYRLTEAFRTKKTSAILKYSAEIGHYIADAHVPLHTSSNHNGQLTNQRGIHGFWESRVPELLAAEHYNFVIGTAAYLSHPQQFIWSRINESAAAVDSVLYFEKLLTDSFPESRKFAFENRAGKTIKQYSAAFTQTYDTRLNGMVERRMRASIFAVASFWYTAWVDAGQPDLNLLAGHEDSPEETSAWEWLNRVWKSGTQMIGREE